MFDIELAVLLFSIIFIVEAISWIGKDTLADIFYAPIGFFSTSSSSKQSRALKSEILKLRAELAATSAQDEFTKWAKLRRRLDRGVAELETSNAQAGTAKKQFATYFKSALWILTTVLPFVISSYHRKRAVFYLPAGWFGPATWWMGLPSAPLGGIACGIWTMACKRTIGTVKNIVVDLVAPVPAGPVPVPVAVPADGGQSEKVKDEL